jgi:hypothetical protein
VGGAVAAQEVREEKEQSTEALDAVTMAVLAGGSTDVSC